jgi:phage-related protein
MSDLFFHVRPGGSCPYEEYVRQVFASGRRKEAAKIRAHVNRLAKDGSQQLAVMKWAEKMNSAWQLRPGHHRIFYFWDDIEKSYVMLNGYEKKTKKTPPGGLARAERLMTEHEPTRN